MEEGLGTGLGDKPGHGHPRGTTISPRLGQMAGVLTLPPTDAIQGTAETSWDVRNWALFGEGGCTYKGWAQEWARDALSVPQPSLPMRAEASRELMTARNERMDVSVALHSLTSQQSFT